jgi:exo-1,4-beta-D-glucosaminidase
MTVTKPYANFTGLSSLPVNPNVTATTSRVVSGAQQTVTITLRNGSATDVAFFVRPEVTAGSGGNEVVPISYTDNYVTLWPGETTTISGTYDTADLGGLSPYLRVRGWNLPTTSTAVP